MKSEIAAILAGIIQVIAVIHFIFTAERTDLLFAYQCKNNLIHDT
ncbi:MAG: hypothetical protein ACXADD_15075 [Candidatus Thorarchaeota archaeon]